MKKLIRITSIPLSAEKLLGNQLTYMNGFYDVTIVSSNEPELKKVAESLGVRHHAVEMTRAITPLKDLKSIWEMYRFFRKEKPEMVHSHTPKAGLVGMIAAFLAGVPIRLHTVAGLPLLECTGVKRSLLSWVERLIYTFCTKVYPNSQELGRIILRENFCPPSKMKVLGHGSSNGIDRAYFDPQKVTEAEKKDCRNKSGIAEDDFVFVFLGRLVKDKGINELVAAFKSLVSVPECFTEGFGDQDAVAPAPAQLIASIEPAANGMPAGSTNNVSFSGKSTTGLHLRNRLANTFQRSDRNDEHNRRLRNGLSGELLTLSGTLLSEEDRLRVKLLLVGPMEEDLDPLSVATLNEIEGNPKILTTGYVQDVRPYLAISNCMVFPSYREGFPNALLQAGAMKLPSIATDINGCNEIITDGENGLIIPVKNEKALAEAMKKMLQDVSLCTSLAAKSRILIEEKYSQMMLWQALKEEYETLSQSPAGQKTPS